MQYIIVCESCCSTIEGRLYNRTSGDHIVTFLSQQTCGNLHSLNLSFFSHKIQIIIANGTTSVYNYFAKPMKWYLEFIECLVNICGEDASDDDNDKVCFF